MSEFLQSTDVIDWHEPEVRARAAALGDGLSDPFEVTKHCFEWVRDAFRLTVTGEADLPGIHSEPLPVVVDALRSQTTVQALWNNLPDVGR